MTKQTRYPQEVRGRAVRMVFGRSGEHESQWAAICSISGKFGMPAETLRTWVRQTERDQGSRPGLATDGRKRMKELERENRGLRSANEILRSKRVSTEPWAVQVD